MTRPFPLVLVLAAAAVASLGSGVHGQAGRPAARQAPSIAFTDVTAAAVHEALSEIHAIADGRPATAEEVALAIASVSKGYPRGFETASQVARSVAQLALHNLPDTYFEEFVPRLAQVTDTDVARVARQYLTADKMTTVIVGDLDKIHGSLPSLGLGPYQLSTADF